MSYVRGIGAELGTGLAALAQNLIGTQNTLEQQAQARKQQELDNAYRQQQASEQTRQFDVNFNYRRDSDAYQHLDAQRIEITKALQAGAFDKDPLMKQRAITLLGQNNKFIKMVESGKVPSQEDTIAYDQFYQDFAEISGVGAAGLGELAARRDAATTRVVENQANVSDYEATYLRDTLPKKIAGFNAQQDKTILEASIYQELAQFTTAQGKAEALASIAKAGGTAAGVVQGLLDAGKIDPDTAAALKTRMGQTDRVAAAAVTQAEGQATLTTAEAEKVTQTLKTTVDALNSSNDMTVQKNKVLQGLLVLDGAAQRAEYLGGIAKNGEIGVGVINQLEKDGVITPEVANAARSKATRVTATEEAQFNILTDTAQITANDRTKSDATLQASIDVFKSDANLKLKTNTAALDLLALRTAGEKGAYLEGLAKLGAPGQAILDGLKESGVITAQQAAAFKAKAGNAQTVEDATTSTAVNQATTTGVQARVQTQTEGAQVQTIQAGAQQAKAEAAVSTGTVQPRIQNAQAQADSATAQAKVDVATIPAQIAARNLAPQTAQAALDAQLTENRFADATFTARVKAVNLNNQTATQQLLVMRQQYSQNAAKFPGELKYLDAQIAVMQAQAKESAARALDANGNGVTDRKSMLQALDSMRKINADERRIAATNLQNTVKRLIPSAKFSVDKYDPKSFTSLVGSASNLTAEQRAELEQAQLAFEAASGKSADLSTAIGQVAAKGRVDPKVAERLGIYSPGEGDADGSDPYGTQTMGGVKMVTKFTGTAPVPRTFNMEARSAISKVAGNLGVDANALASVISFETAGTFNPNQRNPGSSATGLIQFMAGTGGKPGTYYGMTRDQFGKLSFSQQMSYVERYLKERGVGPGSSMADIYQAVAGSGYKAGSAEYEKNKVWDSNGNGVIEANEQTLNPVFAGHVRDYFGGRGVQGPVAQGGTGTSAAPAAPTGLTLNGKSIPAGGTKLLKDAYATATNFKGSPEQKQAKAVQISATLAPMLSQQLGVTVTPQQVFIFLRDNGGRL